MHDVQRTPSASLARPFPFPTRPLRCVPSPFPALPPQRQLRAAELGFMSLLRQAQPPVAAGTTYDDALLQLQETPAWQAITDQKRRRQLYMG